MTQTVSVPAVIDHQNMGPLLTALQDEPEFHCGPNWYRPTGDEWYRQWVILEFPTGEACKDGLTALALIGQNASQTVALTGKERFAAQGLEGKVQVHKDLFSALMNLRDILPERRGRIVRA